MIELFGPKVRLVPYGQRRSLAQRLGLSLVDTAVQAVEDRALWARFGL